jgi:hypothetical protein
MQKEVRILDKWFCVSKINGTNIMQNVNNTKVLVTENECSFLIFDSVLVKQNYNVKILIRKWLTILKSGLFSLQ